MPPAARVSDMHTCPMQTPAVVPIPHVGGPILPPCAVRTLIGFLPAARVGDLALCVGPPDVIVQGSPTVFIEYMLAARIGDKTAHGGVIVTGCPTVLIGDSGSGSGGASSGGGGGLAALLDLLWPEPGPQTEALKNAAAGGALGVKICR